MPDNPISEDDELAADIAGLSPDDELAADIAGLEAPGSQMSPAMQEAAMYEQPEEPARAPEVQFKEKAIGDEPWHTIWSEAIADTPGAVATENLADSFLAHTPDELGAAAFSPKNDPRDRMKFGTGVATDPNTYAAGSQFEDNRRTLEQEQLERSEKHPTAATFGQVTGPLMQAAALPVTGPVTAALAGPGLTAANYMGQGSGGLAERASQAAETAKEHPFATAAGATLPVMAAGAGRGATKAAGDLTEKSAINRVAAIMTPGERATLAANKGGKPGIVRLGNEMDASGLSHNQGSKWWPANWGPASAETVYDNAVALKAKAGPQLGAAEDAIVAVDPTIKVGNISSELRGSADDVSKHSLTSATDSEAAYRRAIADRLDASTNQLPGTPPTVPEGYLDPAVKPVARPPEGPWTPPVPGQEVKPEDWFKYLEDIKQVPPGAPVPPAPVAREAVPSMPPGPSVLTDRDWSDYLLAKQQFENPPSVSSGESPFSRLVGQRRELDKQTNFTTAGGVENAGMKDQVHRQVGTALRQNIRSGLDEAAQTRPELAQPVADWNKANKDFSLASTVEDPALRAMQKEYGGTLGLRDMATATAAQSVGLPAPLAVAAGKMAKGGRGANALAGAQKTLSKAFGSFGANAGPAALATTQAALPDPEVQKEKNESLKENMHEAMESGWNWLKSKLE